MKSLQLTKPHLIVIVGIPGSGKTYFGAQFSKTFNAPFLNFAELQATFGDGHAPKIWDYVLDQLCLTKQTLILEGPGGTKSERQTLSAYARSKGYQTLFVWVQTEPITAQNRATKGTPGVQQTSLLSPDEFVNYASRFEQLTPAEPYMVISGKHTYASQARNVLKKLVEERKVDAKIQAPAERSAGATTPRPGRITIN